MIKSNELRIGNYVLFDDGKQDKITAIWQDGVNGNSHSRWYLERIMPITLTGELLEKLGFQNEGKRNKIIIGEYWTVGRFEISFCNPGFIYIANGYSTFYVENYKYVHQLQNLYFALTGEELTVKEMA